MGKKTEETKTEEVAESPTDDTFLPKSEIAFYLIAVAAIIIYAGIDFYETYGRNPEKKLPSWLLGKGWIREYKDFPSEKLLDVWADNWKIIVLLAASYLTVSKITLLWTSMSCHRLCCAAFTIAVSTVAISPGASIAIVFLHVVILTSSYYSLTVVWLIIVALTITASSHFFLISELFSMTAHPYSNHGFLACYGYFLCSQISVGHTLSSKLTQLQEKGEPVPTLLQHIRFNLLPTLHYAFYMPNYWCGPILTYDMFRERMESRGRVVTVDKSTALWVIWRMCRLLLWFFVLQLIRHYLPVLSYLYNLTEEDKIVYKHLSFAMFLHGQNFMLAYVQLYGWPGVLARLDGIQLLDWPDCIGRVYSYSIMWRVFDRGLFAVLRAHVYLPIGGSRRGVLRQLLAVAATFAYICIFHGYTSNIQAWTILNALQLIGEKIVSDIYSNKLMGILIRHLSPQNERRLVGYLIAWNMMLSNGIIFLFLADLNGFIVFPEYLLLRPGSSHTPLWHLLTMQFAAYCAVQIGRYYGKMVECKVGGKEKVR